MSDEAYLDRPQRTAVLLWFVAARRRLVAGTELLGTFHGQINNGRLHVYLALGVGPRDRSRRPVRDLQRATDHAFSTQIAIGEGSTTVAWADLLRHADVVLDSVEPSAGEDGELLSLALSGGRLGGPTATVYRVVPPDTPLALPRARRCRVAGRAAVEHRHQADRPGPASPCRAREVGTILRAFTEPDYGAGGHTDSDRELSGQYHLTVS